MLNFRVDITKALDTKKIQEISRKAAVNILVGFPSGMQHVPTLHKNQDGNFEGYHHEDPRDIEPMETAELAKMLSYGTDTIPARPFLEEGIDSKRQELVEELRTQASKAVNGGSANWNKVGTMAVGAVQEFVRSDYYKNTVPNSDRTIEYKGSDTPLIDGGNLVQSVQYVVKDGGN